MLFAAQVLSQEGLGAFSCASHGRDLQQVGPVYTDGRHDDLAVATSARVKVLCSLVRTWMLQSHAEPLDACAEVFKSLFVRERRRGAFGSQRPQ